ncbi:MAG: DinB family protein [Phycisphaerales bacterium]|nr:MAG: DinB family protein [Phycisphaerales bacterium]
MGKQIPWTQRTFNFDFPAGLYPELTERIRSAPVRAEAICAGLPPEVLTQRDGDRWSIQENVGHLAGADSRLFMGRLDDYEAGAEVLRPADMTNKATHAANHNDRPFAEVMASFHDSRAAIIARLEPLDEEAFARSAHHPRLDVPMRLVDMIAFMAEHDDYHLARMRELARMFA